MQVRTFSSDNGTWTLGALGPWDVAIVGSAVDSRGRAACEQARLSATTTQVAVVDQDNPRGLRVDGRLLSGRDLRDAVAGTGRMLLEATTLDLVELLHLLKATSQAGLGGVDIMYAEPDRYRVVQGQWLRNFSLSDARRFESVPGFATDLSRRAAQGMKLVAFLGYEDDRLQQVLGQYEEMATWVKTMVFGVPGYATGWELDALANNVATLGAMRRTSVAYCAASSVSGALDLLRREHAPGIECTVVAPLGTKPHAIATALFLVEKCEYQQSTLVWDHPQRSQDRSEEVRRWHLFRVRFAH